MTVYFFGCESEIDGSVAKSLLSMDSQGIPLYSSSERIFVPMTHVADVFVRINEE